MGICARFSKVGSSSAPMQLAPLEPTHLLLILSAGWEQRPVLPGLLLRLFELEFNFIFVPKLRN